MEGWIKSWRCGERHPAFRDGERWRVFSFCLWRAKYKAEPGVPRGAFFLTRTMLFQALNYRGRPSESTLWRKLKELESIGSVSIVTLRNKVSLVTVCNYETYQSVDGDGEPLMNRSWTADEPLSQFAPLEKKEGEEGKNARDRAATPSVAHASQQAPSTFISPSGTDYSTIPADELPGWLAREWMARRRGTKSRNEEVEARQYFEQIIRAGGSVNVLAATICDASRDPTIPVFRFKDDFMRANGLGGRNERGKKAIDHSGLQQFAAGSG